MIRIYVIREKTSIPIQTASACFQSYDQLAQTKTQPDPT